MRHPRTPLTLLIVALASCAGPDASAQATPPSPLPPLLVASAADAPPVPAAPPRWWLDTPVRLIQTNLPENYSTLDAQRLVQAVADYPANTLLFNLGGIVAQYPTQVEFHYPSPYLPPGRDLFGEVLREAHARGVRVIGRFDLSKTQKAVFDAHPEWFFKRVNGEPAIFNGLYSACINGGYYHGHAEKILTEALARYPVDGVFFNMFGNPSTDYAGVPMGVCQCDECKKRFLARYNRPLPTSTRDPDYRAFMNDSSREVAEMMAKLIHRLRPNAAFLTYFDEFTDVIIHESNTSVTRPLPLWPYTSSDHVNVARTSQPDKQIFSLCMSFVDYPWRFITVPPAEIRLRLWENLANGGPPALVVVGSMDQEDRQSLVAAQPVFRWHAQHEDLYLHQENAARVLLLAEEGGAAYRGFFRLLTELHIPFAAANNLKWLDDAQKYDLVIAPNGAPPEVARYVRAGGRLLLAGPRPPPADLPIAPVLGVRPAAQGAWRIHDHALLPSLKDTDLVIQEGAYVELAPLDKPLLTLIPPALGSPPELIWVDKVETTVPGLVFADVGKGRVAYIPWDIGALYYRYSSVAHAGLLADVIDALLPRGRQIKTSAHPLVEMTLMRQPARDRTLVHFVNVAGHADTAYFDPPEMRDITVQLDGDFHRAHAEMLGQDLPLTRAGVKQTFTLPKLGGYEVVVLE